MIDCWPWKWIEPHGQYGIIRCRYMEWVTRMDKEPAEREYIKGTQGEILRTQWKGMREIIPVDDTGHWAQHHLTASTHRPIHIGTSIKQRYLPLPLPAATRSVTADKPLRSQTAHPQSTGNQRVANATAPRRRLAISLYAVECPAWEYLPSTQYNTTSTLSSQVSQHTMEHTAQMKYISLWRWRPSHSPGDCKTTTWRCCIGHTLIASWLWMDGRRSHRFVAVADIVAIGKGCWFDSVSDVNWSVGWVCRMVLRPIIPCVVHRHDFCSLYDHCLYLSIGFVWFLSFPFIASL